MYKEQNKEKREYIANYVTKVVKKIVKFLRLPKNKYLGNAFENNPETLKDLLFDMDLLCPCHTTNVHCDDCEYHIQNGSFRNCHSKAGSAYGEFKWELRAVMKDWARQIWSEYLSKELHQKRDDDSIRINLEEAVTIYHKVFLRLIFLVHQELKTKKTEGIKNE